MLVFTLLFRPPSYSWKLVKKEKNLVQIPGPSNIGSLMYFISPVYITWTLPSLSSEAIEWCCLSSSGKAILKQELANFPANRKNIYQLLMRTEAKGGSDSHLSEPLNIRAARCLPVCPNCVEISWQVALERFWSTASTNNTGAAGVTSIQQHK